jgi:hypothetical protein
VITITGLGDHDPPEWLITITGLRNQWVAIKREGQRVEIARFP